MGKPYSSIFARATLFAEYLQRRTREAARRHRSCGALDCKKFSLRCWLSLSRLDLWLRMCCCLRFRTTARCSVFWMKYDSTFTLLKVRSQSFFQHVWIFREDSSTRLARPDIVVLPLGSFKDAKTRYVSVLQEYRPTPSLP